MTAVYRLRLEVESNPEKKAGFLRPIICANLFESLPPRSRYISGKAGVYMFAIISSPNSEHLSFVAPFIKRSKS
jgi:hypothetical protein